MNDKTNYIHTSWDDPLQTMSKYALLCLTAGMLFLTTACSNLIQPDVVLTIDPALQQAVFKTPEQAADVFVQALTEDDEAQLRKILGADFREILPLDELSDADVDKFIVAWNKFNTLIPHGDKKMMLAVGKGEWTMPIPIVLADAGWYFDIDRGLENMRIRRIGRHELATIQSVLAYYDAQMEYAEIAHDGNRFLSYAQQFISTPGTHDGLYWESEPDAVQSPLGYLIADKTPGGGYHGYYYHILKAQGDSATGGAYDYLIGTDMRAGFALVAWPEQYGESGVMTFMISHAGIVYQQDLGPDTSTTVLAMQRYNPGADWVQTKDVSLTGAIAQE